MLWVAIPEGVGRTHGITDYGRRAFDGEQDHSPEMLEV
jgi:hypothetical protein